MLPSWLKISMPYAGRNLRVLIVTSGFVNVLALAPPVFVLQVYDRVVFYQGHNTLIGLFFGVSIALLFDYIFRQARSRIVQSAALRVDAGVGRGLFTKLLNLPLRRLELRQAGEWQTLFRDLELIRNAVAGPPILNLVDLSFAVVFVIVLLIVAPTIAWVVAAFIPVYLILSAWSGLAIAASTSNEQASRIARNNLLTELTAARTTVKSLAMEAAVQNAWEERHAASIDHAKVRGRKSDRFQNAAYTISMLTTICLTTVGAIAIMQQELSIGSLIAANMLSSRVFSPFVQLVGTWRALTEGSKAAKRIQQVLAEAEDVAATPLPMERPKGELVLENVDFSYDTSGMFHLQALNLKIGPGGMHAIIGASGSGKTTLLKLLAGLYALESGRILVDGADISQYLRRELAQHIGYQPQETVLFSGTIRDNLVLASADADDAAIVLAAKRAGLHEFVINLPDGYGTQIGEWGGRLSGGQRQRLALARCLVPDPPILLLDEPTSHLDPRAERELSETLAGMATERTIVLVSHSHAMIKNCDTVAEFADGRLVMAGPAKSVLSYNEQGQGKLQITGAD